MKRRVLIFAALAVLSHVAVLWGGYTLAARRYAADRAEAARQIAEAQRGAKEAIAGYEQRAREAEAASVAIAACLDESTKALAAATAHRIAVASRPVPVTDEEIREAAARLGWAP